MHYVSPFHFLGSSFEVSQLKLERKKKLAELELSPTKTLNISGRDYSKDELVELFDSFTHLTEEELHFHQLIFEEKHLLQFLENGTFQPFKTAEKKTAFHAKEQFYQEPLLSFISPYYKQRALEVWKKAFKTSDIALTYYLFKSHQPLLNAPDLEDYYRSIEMDYEQWCSSLKHLEYNLKEGVKNFEGLEPYLTSNTYITVLNLLPESFDSTRKQTALTLAALGVTLGQQNEAKRSKRLFQYIRRIQLDEASQRIIDVYEIALDIKRDGNKRFIGQILFIIFMLAIGLSRCYEDLKREQLKTKPNYYNTF